MIDEQSIHLLHSKFSLSFKQYVIIVASSLVMNLDGQGLSLIALSSKNRICGATGTNILRMTSTYSLTKVLFLFFCLVSVAKHFLIGYPLTKYSIRPFSDFDLTNNNAEAADRKQWNVSLSRLRFAIENAFGHLKGRFPSLQNMPGHNIDEMFRTIEALLIIHNIVEEFGDDPETIPGFNGQEDADVGDVFHGVPVRLSDDELYWTGLA